MAVKLLCHFKALPQELQDKILIETNTEYANIFDCDFAKRFFRRRNFEEPKVILQNFFESSFSLHYIASKLSTIGLVKITTHPVGIRGNHMWHVIIQFNSSFRRSYGACYGLGCQSVLSLKRCITRDWNIGQTRTL